MRGENEKSKSIYFVLFLEVNMAKVLLHGSPVSLQCIHLAIVRLEVVIE